MLVHTVNGIREENILFTDIITELKKCATVRNHKKVVYLDDAIGIIEQASPKILLVEDGSVDVDGLDQFIYDNDLPIKIVLYRQGSIPPRFLYDSKM